MTADSACLYRRVLGERWHALPPALQAMHHLQEARVARGRAQTRRGTSMLSRAVGRASVTLHVAWAGEASAEAALWSAAYHSDGVAENLSK